MPNLFRHLTCKSGLQDAPLMVCRNKFGMTYDLAFSYVRYSLQLIHSIKHLQSSS